MDIAILGFIGLVILFGVPLAALLILGANAGRKRTSKTGNNWKGLFKLDPAEFINSINKVRPK